MGGEDFPIETFDALLRDLLTCGLVVRSEGDDGKNWRLVARAQQRLGDLAITVGPWPAERTAYLDRQCADCGRRKLTWVRKDSFLCDACWQKRFGCRQAKPASLASTPRRPRERLIIGHEFTDPRVERVG